MASSNHSSSLEQVSESYLMTRSDDPMEKDRLDLQHQVWTLLLHGKLSSLDLDSPKAILDIGCGGGSWTLAIAKAYPLAHVIGVDLTPPSSKDPAVPNCHFFQRNVETEPWDLDLFDFIHCRQLNSGVLDWDAFLKQCYDHLKPLGQVELLDICHPWRSETASSATSPFLRLGEELDRAWMRSGRDYSATHDRARLLNHRGFVNVTEEDLFWPIGPWPEDPVKSQIGLVTLSIYRTYLDSVVPAILMHQSDRSEDLVRDMASAAMDDLESNWSTKKFWLQAKIHRAFRGLP